MAKNTELDKLKEQAKEINAQIERLQGKQGLKELVKAVKGKCLLLDNDLYTEVRTTSDSDTVWFEGNELQVSKCSYPRFKKEDTVGYTLQYINDLKAKGKFEIITDTDKFDKLVHKRMLEFENHMDLVESVITMDKNRRYATFNGETIKKMDSRSLVTVIRDEFDGLLFECISAYGNTSYLKFNVVSFDNFTFAVKMTTIGFYSYLPVETGLPIISESQVFGVRLYPNDPKTVSKMITAVKSYLCDKSSKTITWNALSERIESAKKAYFGGNRQQFLKEVEEYKRKIKNA